MIPRFLSESRKSLLSYMSTLLHHSGEDYKNIGKSRSQCYSRRLYRCIPHVLTGGGAPSIVIRQFLRFIHNNYHFHHHQLLHAGFLGVY